MISVVITLLLTLAAGWGMSRIFNRRIEECVPVFLTGTIVFLYIFYIFNLLLIGRIAVYAVCAGFIAAGVFFQKKRRTGCFTPGILLFLALSALFVIYAISMMPSVWDELRLWAAMPKALHYSEALQVGEGSLLYSTMQSYPPGMALLIYFFTAFFPSYSYGAAFAVYWIFVASLVLPAFRNLKWHQWYLLFPVFFLFVLFPVLLTINGGGPSGDWAYYYTSLYIEPTLGCLFGYALYQAIKKPFASAFSTASFALTLFVLPTLKNIGAMYACVVFAAAVLLYIAAGRKSAKASSDTDGFAAEASAAVRMNSQSEETFGEPEIECHKDSESRECSNSSVIFGELDIQCHKDSETEVNNQENCMDSHMEFKSAASFDELRIESETNCKTDVEVMEHRAESHNANEESNKSAKTGKPILSMLLCLLSIALSYISWQLVINLLGTGEFIDFKLTEFTGEKFVNVLGGLTSWGHIPFVYMIIFFIVAGLLTTFLLKDLSWKEALIIGLGVVVSFLLFLYGYVSHYGLMLSSIHRYTSVFTFACFVYLFMRIFSGVNPKTKLSFGNSEKGQNPVQNKIGMNDSVLKTLLPKKGVKAEQILILGLIMVASSVFIMFSTKSLQLKNDSWDDAKSIIKKAEAAILYDSESIGDNVEITDQVERIAGNAESGSRAERISISDYAWTASNNDTERLAGNAGIAGRADIESIGHNAKGASNNTTVSNIETAKVSLCGDTKESGRPNTQQQSEFQLEPAKCYLALGGDIRKESQRHETYALEAIGTSVNIRNIWCDKIFNEAVDGVVTDPQAAAEIWAKNLKAGGYEYVILAQPDEEIIDAVQRIMKDASFNTGDETVLKIIPCDSGYGITFLPLDSSAN